MPFLQWALPRMGLRWQGFRKPRRQVCRRIGARFGSLGLSDYGAYRAYLEQHPAEWGELDSLCRVTISRFFRDRRVLEDLPGLLDELASGAAGGGRRGLRVWSAGCASGEEPYSIVMATLDVEPAIEVVATDADAGMIERARRGRYGAASLRAVDEALRERAFARLDGDGYELRAELRERVRFLVQDVRVTGPPGSFDVVFCRNLAFTYFDAPTQEAVLRRFAAASRPGAALVVGAHEALPAGTGYEPDLGRAHTFRLAPPVPHATVDTPKAGA